MITEPIIHYSAERDRLEIETLLKQDKYYADMFKEAADDCPENIWVARRPHHLLAVLFHDGLQRGTEFTIFVGIPYRRNGIGSALLSMAHQFFGGNHSVERAKCATADNEASFLQKHGYRHDYDMSLMTYNRQALAVKPIEIRQYQDDDYQVFQNLHETVFFELRKNLGYPLWYRPSSEHQRQQFLKDKHNRYVVTKDLRIIAIGIISGDSLEAVAVHPDFRGQGYGSSLIAYLINELLMRQVQTIYLWVDKGNQAKSLYETLGFETVGLYTFWSKRYRPETRPSGPPPNLAF